MAESMVKSIESIKWKIISFSFALLHIFYCCRCGMRR